jgi:hypothetical protein
MTRSLAIFAASFAAAAALLYRALPPPPSLLEEKLASFDVEADQYTTVFVGTSAVYRGVVPSLLDEELGARGVSSRTFNFGLPGGSAGEALYVAERVLARRPAKLRYLIIDGGLVGFPEPSNLRTRRNLEWHGPSRAAASFVAALRARRPLEALEEARAGLYRAFSVGVSSDWIQSEPTERRVGDDGFVALDWGPTEGTRHRDFLLRLDAYRANVEKMSHDDRRPEDETYSAAMLAEVVALSRRRGVQPIVLRPPTVTTPVLSTLDAPVVRFDDPRRYPELYDPAVRYDQNHLNEQGARAFTRLLAGELATFVHAVR